MQIAQLTANQREEWNSFVAQQPFFALLQSWEWGEFKEKLGWKPFRLAVTKQGQIVAGAQVLIKPAPGELTSIAYVPRGPIGNWLDEDIVPQLLSELHHVAHCYHAIFLKIEPPLLNNSIADEVLPHYKFYPSHYTNQPKATIIIDLTSNLDDIWQQVCRKTRYNIKYGPKQGVTVRIGSQADLPNFYKLMQITGQRDKFSPRSLDYYGHEWQTYVEREQAILLMAYYQGELLAARMAFRFGHHAADFHAASSNDHRHLRPNHLLVWETIKWAKAHGCQTYDLWGIPDEVGQAACSGAEPPASAYRDNLWGVYQFKRSFSNKVIFYTGAYDYVFSPWLYTVLTNNLVNGKVLERLAVWSDRLKYKAI